MFFVVIFIVHPIGLLAETILFLSARGGTEEELRMENAFDYGKRDFSLFAISIARLQSPNYSEITKGNKAQAVTLGKEKKRKITS